MQTYKPFALSLTTRCIEYRQRLGMCVSAWVYFPFVEPTQRAALWTEMGMWQFLAKQLPEDAADVGVVKRAPEFLVRGIAYPGGVEANACAVRVKVGPREKTLLVSGERHWEGDRISQPAPFESLPLSWRHAYGGPDFPDNPLGTGRTDAEVNGVQVRHLPRVELASPRLLRPDDVVPPAGFGMLDQNWPQRAQYRGTYDDAWFKEHSPGFAPDLDWKFFNTAPPDQWFDAPLVGDEAFEFDNLHPTKPKVAGRLPGVRTRVFCNLRSAQGLRLTEVPMQLKTLWFFPHAERGVLIYQGLLPVTDEDAADVEHMMGAVERLGEPKSEEHYARVLKQRLDPQKGALYTLRDSDLLPEGVSGSDPDFDAAQDDFKLKGLMAEAQRRHAEVQIELTRAQVKAQGLDPDALNIRMPPREKVPTLEELPDYLEQKLAEVAQQQKSAFEEAAKQVSQANAIAQKAGIDLDAARHRGPPLYNAAAHLQALMSQIPADLRNAAGKPVIDFQALAPKLVQAEAASRLSYLMSAHLQPPAHPLPPQAAAAFKEEMRQAYAKGMNFRSANLTGADLSGLDLRQADFTAAQMESVNLSGANVSGANFSNAVLAHGNLSGLVAIGSNFTGANLGAAKLDQAAFDQANLGGAILMRVNFSGTSFRGARLDGANVLESTYGAADWTEASCAGLHFIKADLKGMLLAGAKMGGVNFIECDLSGVNLEQAELSGANLMTCKGQGAILRQASLLNAIFAMGCDFSGTDFSAARMTGCNLRGAVLSAAKFCAATLDQADCSEARLDGADLSRASAKGALFIKSDLRGGVCAGLNWMEAIVQRADLRGTDLRGSNLFGCDLSRIRVDAQTRFDDSLATRARTYPRRRQTPDEQPEPAA
jgi:uncharacterized protein YjbI with pentapeptide repeats